MFYKAGKQFHKFTASNCARCVRYYQRGVGGPSRGTGNIGRLFSPGKIILGGFASFVVWFYFRFRYDVSKPLPKERIPPIDLDIESNRRMIKEKSKEVKQESGLSKCDQHILLSHYFGSDGLANTDHNQRKIGLQLCIGDFTEDSSMDAIVNDANEYLRHQSAIAHSILIKGGPEMQDLSIEYIKKNGRLKASEVSLQKCTGSLHCKYLIHAVVPQWNGGKQDEIGQLERTIYNALKAADENGLKRIAIPAIGADIEGIFCAPLNLAARALIMGTTKYLNEYSGNTGIEMIRFYNYDTASSGIFYKEFKKIFPEAAAPCKS